MASATKRIILSSGWQRIAQAKGREAMALIDSYGSVQLAVAEGEPPRGDVASGHSLNGSMMWPVKGADIIWARGAGVAVSVTLLKVVPEFATLDSAALKVATASAQAVATAAAGAAATADAKAVTADNKATAADAKATEAQAVQARRDFAKWQLIDYIDASDMEAAYARDLASQDEARVTADVHGFFEDVIDWWKGSPGRFAQIIGLPVTLAVNDEIFSEYFAQQLWDMGNWYDDNRFEIVANGLEFRAKNWLARAAVRTSGFWAAQGITDPVPKVMFRWEQSSSRQFSPQITGRLTLSGEDNPATDPIGVKTMSMNMAFLDKLRIRDFRNTGKFNENFFNSGVGDLDIIRCGYQPTDFGGTGFLPETVRFSNVGAVVEATEAVFDASHVGKWFGLVGAGPSRSGLRQIHWSEVTEVTDNEHIVLGTTPDSNVTGQIGSFEAVRGNIEANSNILELSTPISESLIGRYITVVGCGQQGAPSDFGTLTARVVAHSGDQVTLSHNARLTRSDVAVVVAPGLYQGRSADFMLTPRGQNNDVTYHNMRLVGGDRCYMVPAVLVDNNAVDFEPGTKFHGSPPAGNNFAGNFSGLIYDVAETVNLVNCLVEHNRHSPRFGCHFMTGGNVQVDVIGGVSGDFHSGTESAEVYNDMQASPTVAQLTHSAIRHRGYVANQMLLRLGANGLTSQVLGGASSRASRRTPDGKAFPNRIAGNGGPQTGRPNPAYLYERWFNETLGRDEVWTGAEWEPARGNRQPPNIQNLDTMTNVTRNGIATSTTVGAPDALGAWYVEIFRGPGGCTIQTAHRIRLNTVPVTVIRHNNNGGGSWSAWCLPDGTILTP